MVAKVLDFTRREQTADVVGKPRELLVRCDGYRVTLPTSRSGEVLENPFERVVLRLLDLRRYDVEGLVSETRLPGDLVRFILLRLVDEGYLDQRHDLLDAGRAALDKLDRAGSAAVEYSTHLVFRERISGTLLPMLVSTNDLPLLEAEDGDQLAIFVGSNAANAGRQNSTRPIYPSVVGRKPVSNAAPVPREIEAVLARMSQRARVLGTSGQTRSVGQGILITSEPEPYLLRCKQVIQKFDGDWRITDPFGQGYSVDLERAYRELVDRDEDESTKLLAWQSRIASQAAPRPSDAPTVPSYGDPRNIQLYPDLVRSLRLAQWYGAVEWALFYLNQGNDLTQAVQLAKVQTSPANEKAVLEAAQDLGFAANAQLLRGLVDLRAGRISAFQEGSAGMATVLPLAVLSASQNPGHPLLGLADEMPELVEVVAFLKSQRDDELHHKTNAPKGDGPLPSPLDTWTQQLVRTLLPTFNFDGDVENTLPRSASVDDRLDARLKLQSEFGRAVFGSWPSELQDNLLDSELAWLALGGDEPSDASTFVNRLATATQSAFRHALDRMPLGTPVEGDYVAIAADRAERHGFGPLPDSVRAVPTRRVEKSLYGGQGTLGSVIAAYLVRADETDLTRLERHREILLRDLDRLIKLRGHGNRRVETDHQERDSLRQGIYTIIRSLLES
ncbi:hypothetical protein [Cellulomonas humilata]|uniref:Uncharacterized protein n=1 Tax=Cellulomonas humilata TaxID=144055 RepID=A0ABU0EL96_9CELL|nr:hypothetical protein [Cellulomonas humilata]MDQ0375992.1 hypothetical protein [Cellulomonas humilata]